MLPDIQTIRITTGIMHFAALMLQHDSQGLGWAAFQGSIITTESMVLDCRILISCAKAHLRHPREHGV